LPPLRERPTDIPILINHFLNEENPNLPNIFFDASTLKYLTTFPWHGNIRELRNEMEKIRLFYSDKKILTMNELSNKYKIKIPPPEPIQKISLPSNIIKTETPAQKSPLNLTSKFRRLEELKGLFVTHTKLTRIEVESLLQVSPNTALSYLNTLEQEKFISKKTFANTKTHYYEIV
jgi:DNA-binding NtrC family response regulator